jgi:hypothetical protein
MPEPLSEAQQARNDYGAAVRRGDPPEVIDQARRRLEAAARRDRIRREVAGWPPFTAEQEAGLALLLGTSDDGAT